MSDDQDFFFDEEETQVEKPAAAPAKSAAGKTAPRAGATAPAAQAAAAVQTVTMTVAALIGVVALLTGVIIGIVLPVGATNSVPAPTTTGVEAPAPQLSPEELESGALPEGHPDIGAMGGEVPTDSVPATTAP